MAGKSEDGTNPEVHIWRIAPTRRDLLGFLGWGAVLNAIGIGTLAFVAAVFGGIGSIPGAMLGGVLLGFLGELVKFTSFSGMKDAIVFLLLVLVLLFRPAGLLGSARAEKV